MIAFKMLLIITIVLIVMMNFLWMSYLPKFSLYPVYVIQKRPYHETTGSCQMPALDPWDASIAGFFKVPKPLKCPHSHPFNVFSGGDVRYPTIHINVDELAKLNLRCYYRILRRIRDSLNSKSGYKRIRATTINVTDEFVRIECVHGMRRGNNVVYIDHFPFIIRKQHVEDRVERTKSQAFLSDTSSNKLSVLLLSIDSTSRNNYLRHMNKTIEYLAKFHRDALIEFRSYNKVGASTYPNILAMLTGHRPDELPDLSVYYADGFPFVWKTFADAGYRTLHSQDAPYFSIFNLGKKGFKTEPTDYYLRPYSMAMESYLVFIRKGQDHGCFNSRLEADVILNWTGDFFDMFPDEPLFAFTHLARLTHGDFNGLTLLDESILRFLQRLERSGHLNRTIMFFFSDHGFRIGRVYSTYSGRQEGNRPFMNVLVPPWFSRRHPELYANLKVNSRRLTTAFDIHATLEGVLRRPRSAHGDTSPKRKRSVNLFRSLVSEKRTCGDAAIPLHMCACARFEHVDTQKSHVVVAAQKMVEKINAMTRLYRNSCTELELEEVVKADVEVVLVEEYAHENASKKYRLTVRLGPSNATFEGTVRYLATSAWHLNSANRYAVHNDIDRIDVYGNQSACVDLFHLKPFCYCKQFLSQANKYTNTTRNNIDNSLEERNTLHNQYKIRTS